MPDLIDYRSTPLGALPGEEHLQAPYNQRPMSVVVRVRNVSALQKRLIVKEYVSWRSGGDKQLQDSKYSESHHGKTSVDVLRARAANGENMNWETEQTVATDFIIRHDNRRYLVPALDADGKPAPWIVVEPGVWDLYMGNWERMHSRNPRERTDEINMLNGRNLNRFVISNDPNDPRPYGFLEFEREEIKIADVVVDSDRVSSGRLIEV